MEIHDQLHRKLHFKTSPKRIVSLVPSQTELLCDLGLKNHIVGVTKFCIHPKDIKKHADVVGGTKQIQFDKMAALQPDIILCNKEENTIEIVDVCQTLCNVHVSDVITILDSIDMIKQYGAIFNKEEKALGIADTIINEQRDFELFMKPLKPKRTAYFIWKSPWMVAANHTFINNMMRLNKFENVYEGQSRYPEIQLSSLQPNMAVDLVILSSEPYPFKTMHFKEVQAYFPNAQIVLGDGEYFSWHGSRLAKAFKYFKNLHATLQDNPL
ncbi:ABC transporter substrate-binding protein [Mariniflexile sp.]|uniref:ABC transporter substrate-binding protein n=1 Tax=Mariniflexile sp. TaxID=1979402 RepID=UPI004047D3EC